MKILLGSVSRGILSFASFSLLATTVGAQTFQLNAVYQCPADQSFRVFSCAGNAPADACDVQSYSNGQPNMRGQSQRQQVVAMMSLCHLQTPAEAQGQGRGGAAAAPVAQQQAGTGGFKVGETVQINTAFGWMDAQVLRVNGNNYYVHAQAGADVWKTYPTELRRIGKLNDIDRANGLYAPGDRVQVNVGGRWIDGKIETELNQEYNVVLTDNRTVWTKGANLRLAASPAPAAGPTGTSPKPGFTSCAGKVEGRYSNSGGFGNLTIVFRSGKATVPSTFGGGEDVFECWMSGTKIILHKPGESVNTDMPLDINNDGTIDTPLGEIKKKGN
jgi:hypothetical protein